LESRSKALPGTGFVESTWGGWQPAADWQSNATRFL
jgi:hypothetical protein